MKYITRTIWILSIISLFTDIASEMLYPVMPVYLKSIGFSVLLIGILEGLAEATAGLSKGYFGKQSDASGKRVPFIRLGYFLSAVSKPIMGLLITPAWIFIARTMDRFGKGIRTSARDAMLADESTPETRGKVFGFHRSMDTLGAVIGPLCALVFLYFYPHHYAPLFLFAFIPGMFAVGAAFFLKDKRSLPHNTKNTNSFFGFLQYWKQSSMAYRRVVAGLLLFTLFNSSDVFLLLKLKQSGFSDLSVIGMYVLYNLIYAMSSFPAGVIADKLGMRNTFITGLLLFCLVYAGMSVNHNPYVYVLLFLIYGLYAATNEGISKAWISRITAKQDTATAIGFFTGFQSICVLTASTVAGAIWAAYGAPATFAISAGASLFVIFYLLLLTDNKHAEHIQAG